MLPVASSGYSWLIFGGQWIDYKQRDVEDKVPLSCQCTRKDYQKDPIIKEDALGHNALSWVCVLDDNQGRISTLSWMSAGPSVVVVRTQLETGLITKDTSPISAVPR
ncbi:hypothetical protein TNCV_3649741 [Trichonephila clavipes]|nr:hypothetical protein TNCV_3649741 [Trichonephila clavipes]